MPLGPEERAEAYRPRAFVNSEPPRAPLIRFPNSHGDVRASRLRPQVKVKMWYAIFSGDGHYHLMRPQVNYTLCGRPTLKRDRDGADYRPPARVLGVVPPASQYRSCHRCAAEANSGRLKRNDATLGDGG